MATARTGTFARLGEPSATGRRSSLVIGFSADLWRLAPSVEVLTAVSG